MNKKRILATMGVTLFSSTLWLATNKTSVQADETATPDSVNQVTPTTDNQNTADTTATTSDLAAGKIAAKNAINLSVQTATSQINNLTIDATQKANLLQQLQGINDQFAAQVEQAQTTTELTQVQATAQAQVQTIVQQATSLTTTNTASDANNTSTTNTNVTTTSTTDPASAPATTNTTDTTSTTNTDQTPASVANVSGTPAADASQNVSTTPTATDATPAASASNSITSTKPHIANYLYDDDPALQPDDTGTVYISTAHQFLAALAPRNIGGGYSADIDKIKTIVLLNDITITASDMSNSDIYVGDNRTVTVKSADDHRYYLDMRGNRVVTSGDITFQNLDIYGSTYWGVVNPQGTPTITFDNISYTGAQMIHASNGQTVIIKGNVSASSVPSYVSPYDNSVIKPIDDYQQVIEISGSGKVDFTEGSTFTGTTYKDDVIDIEGAGTVTLEKGATVNLNAHSHGLSAQNSGSNVAGIYISSAGTIDAQAGSILNINVVGDDAKDTAQAINLGSGSSLHLEQGSKVNIKNNGSIYSGLVNISGTLQVDNKADFEIVGQNMNDFNGPILNITNGTINLTGGTFKAQVDGTGATTLLNIAGAHVNIDNPQDFVLDATTNSNAHLISDGQFALNDVKYISADGTVSGPLDKLNMNISSDTVGTINDPADASAASDIVGENYASEQPVVSDLSGKDLTGSRIEFVSAGPFVDVDQATIDPDKTVVSGHTNNTNAYIYVVVKHSNGTTTPLPGTLDTSDKYWRDSAPKYVAQSDAQGNFSFAIPANTLQPGDHLELSANKDFVDSIEPLDFDPEAAAAAAAALQSTKDTAIQALQAAQTAANDQIAKANLTDAQRQTAQQAVADAYTTAAKSVNLATSADAINTAQTNGVAAINAAAQTAIATGALDNAKSAAQKTLDDELTKVNGQINGFKNLTDTQKTTLKAQAQQAHDTAVAQVTAATNTTDITNAQTAGVTAIDAVAKTAQDDDTTALTKAKADAITALKAAQTAAHNQLSKSKLTAEQRVAAMTQVDNLYTAAEKKINAATDSQAATTAEKTGQTQMNQAAMDAINTGVLANDKLAATQALDTELATVNDQIDGLKNLTTTQVTALKAQVQKAHDDAVTNVNAAADHASVSLAQKTGITNIDAVLDTANSSDALNAAQTAALAALTQAQTTANTKIDGSSLSAAQKKAAKQKVQTAFDSAKTQVNAATDPTVVQTAQKNGQSAIANAADTAITAGELANAQASAKKALDAELSQVNDQIEQLQNLTDTQKTAAKAQAQTAHDAAVTAVNKATTVADVTTSQKTGISKIDAALTTAQTDDTKALSQSQTAALTALTTAQNDANAKIEASSLSDEQKKAAKQQVQAAYDAAVTQVNGAKNPTDLAAAQTAGQTAITNAGADAIAAGELVNAQTAAQQKLAAELSRVNDQIDQLQNLTDTQKAAAKAQAQTAYDAAITAVNQATTVADVTSAQTAGITKIDAALTTAQTDDNKALGQSQTNALTTLTTAQNDANAKIEASSLSDEQKQAAKQQVQAAYNSAAAQVNLATNPTDLAAAQSAGTASITQAGEDAIAAGKLANAQTAAQQKLDAELSQVNDQIDQLQNLSADQKQVAKSQAKADHDAAIKDVNAATTIADVTSAQNTGITKIDAALETAKSDDTKALGQSQTNALTALATAQNDANAKIDASSLTAEQKTAAKQQVQAAYDKAAQQVKSATNPADLQAAQTAGTTAITQAGEDAIAAGKLVNAQTAAQQKLAVELSQVNDQVDQLQNLTSDQKDAAKTQAQKAYDAAIKDINAATTIADVTSAQDTGITKIDAALETAKSDDASALAQSQTTALTALATAQNDANAKIEASSLTTEQKTAAKQKVQDAYDAAAQQVKAATNPADLQAAQTAGTTAITQAGAAAITAGELSNAQTAAKTALDSELDKVKGKIAQLQNLTADQKADAENQAQTAHDNAVTAVNTATTVADVTSAQNTGIANIDATLTTAQTDDNNVLSQNQTTALNALVTAQNDANAKIAASSLSDEQKTAAKQKVKDAYDAAVAQVNSANNPTALDQAQTDGKNAILQAGDNAITAGELANAQATAQEKLAAELSQVKDQIDQLQNLTADQKADAQAQAQKSYDDAVETINAATTVADVTAAQETGKTNIDDALKTANDSDATTFQNSKNDVLAALVAAQQSANDEIAASSLSDEQKIAAKQKVQAAYNAAVAQVNTATNPSELDQAQTDGKNAIIQAGAAAISASELINAQDAAKTALDTDLANVISQIGQLQNLTADQKADAENQAQTAHDNAVTAVNTATTVADVTNAQKTGIENINAALNMANNDDASDLQNSQNSATAALTTAQTAANSQIDNSTLTDEQKAAAKQKVQIAYNAAIDKVKAATGPTELTSAQNNGVNDINTAANNAIIAGELANAKSAAHSTLDAELQTVNDQIDQLQNLTTDQKADAKAQAQKARDAAMTAVSAATTVADVTTARDAGKTNIDKALDTASASDAAALQSSKSDVVDTLAAAQNDANAKIEASSLSDEQKQAAKQQVQAAYNAAVEKVNSATNPTDLDQAQTDGQAAITQAGADAIAMGELVNAQTAAQQKLAAELSQVKDQIDQLQNLTADQKAAAKAQAQTAYDTAITAVNQATTLADVTSAQTAGITKIDAALTTAQTDDNKALGQSQTNALTALTTAQNAANAKIESSSLSDEQKQVAKQQVQAAYNSAAAQVNLATNPTDLAAAQSAGTASITQAGDNAIAADELENAQAAAKDTLDSELDKVNNEIDQLKNLTDTQKATAKNQARQAHDNAIKTVNAETTIADVTSAQNTGITKIDAALETAKSDDSSALGQSQTNVLTALTTAQNDANTKIDASSLTAEQKTAAKQQVQAAYDKAAQQVKSATNPADLQAAQSTGQAAITQAGADAIAVGELANAQSAAKDALDNELDKVNNEIDQLKNLTDTQKATAKAQAQQAYNDAVTAVNTATTVADVTSAQETGKTNIDKALTTAQTDDKNALGQSKTAALTALNDAQKSANDKIDASSLSDEQKQAAKQKVKVAYDAAAAQVNSATNPTDMNKAQTDGKNAIMQAGDAAITAGELSNAQKAAKAALDSELDKVKGKIDQLQNLTADQKAVAKSQAQKAHDAALNAVNNSTTVADVTSAQTTGVTKIGAALTTAQSDDASALGQSQTNALTALSDAQKAANDKIAASSLTDEQKTAAKQKVQDAYDAAAAQVNSATNPTDMNKSQTDGKNAITQAGADAIAAGELANAQTAAKAALDSELDKVKGKIDQLQNLTADQKSAAKAQAQKAHDDAMTAVNTATNVGDVTNAQNTGKTNIDKVLDTANTSDATALQNSKTDVLAALSAAQKAANNKIVASSLSDEQKQAAKQKVQDAYDVAAAKVNAATNPTDLATEQDNGQAAITQAGAAAIAAGELANAQAAAQQKLDTELSNINAQIDKLKNLTDQQKTDLENQAQQAHDAAIAAVNAAKTVADVTSAQDEGKTNIDKVLDTAEGSDAYALSQAQAAVVTELTNAQTAANAKIDASSLTAEQKATAKQQVQAAVEQAKTKVNDTHNPTDLQAAQADGTKQIATTADTAIAAFELTNAQTVAQQALADQLAQVNAIIDQLSNLTAKQKADFKSQAQQAHDAAISAVNAAQTPMAVTTAQTDGVKQLTAVVTSAQQADADALATAKLNAQHDLQASLNAANQAINAMNLAPKQKTALIQQAQQAYDQALTAINQATQITAATTAQTAGSKALNDLVAANTNHNLAQAQTDAIAALQNALTNANQLINAMTVTDDKKQALLANAQSAFDQAKLQVKQAQSSAAVHIASDQGIQAIHAVTVQNVASDVNQAKADANQALDQALATANKQIDDLHISQAKKDQLKQQLADNHAAAQQEVNDSTTNTGAALNGIAGIENFNSLLRDMVLDNQPPIITLPSTDDSDADKQPTTTPTNTAISGVVTVKPNVNAGFVTLYDQNGQAIDRVVGAKTSWKTNNRTMINGELYYHVAPNEYLKASDVNFNTAKQATVVDGVLTVRSDLAQKTVPVYDAEGQIIANRSLTAGTQWLTNGAQEMINGQAYYQVAPNEYLAASDINWTPQAMVINKKVGTLAVNNSNVAVYVYDAAKSLMVKSTTQTLANTNAWRYDYQLIVNGHVYYRVAANEWVEQQNVLSD